MQIAPPLWEWIWHCIGKGCPLGSIPYPLLHHYSIARYDVFYMHHRYSYFLCDLGTRETSCSEFTYSLDNLRSDLYSYHSHSLFLFISCSMAAKKASSSGDGRYMPPSSPAQLRNRSIAVVISALLRSLLLRSTSTSPAYLSMTLLTNKSRLHNRLKYSCFTNSTECPTSIANNPRTRCRYLFCGDVRFGLNSVTSITFPDWSRVANRFSTLALSSALVVS